MHHPPPGSLLIVSLPPLFSLQPTKAYRANAVSPLGAATSQGNRVQRTNRTLSPCGCLRGEETRGGPTATMPSGGACPRSQHDSPPCLVWLHVLFACAGSDVTVPRRWVLGRSETNGIQRHPPHRARNVLSLFTPQERRGELLPEYHAMLALHRHELVVVSLEAVQERRRRPPVSHGTRASQASSTCYPVAAPPSAAPLPAPHGHDPPRTDRDMGGTGKAKGSEEEARGTEGGSIGVRTSWR
jgi:hypothetical protein